MVLSELTRLWYEGIGGKYANDATDAVDGFLTGNAENANGLGYSKPEKWRGFNTC